MTVLSSIAVGNADARLEIVLVGLLIRLVAAVGKSQPAGELLQSVERNAVRNVRSYNWQGPGPNRAGHRLVEIGHDASLRFANAGFEYRSAGRDSGSACELRRISSWMNIP